MSTKAAQPTGKTYQFKLVLLGKVKTRRKKRKER
jgi:hypothetical protein